MKRRAVFNWSGGKDSALALYKVLQSGEFDVVELLCSVNADSGQTPLHHIPESLLFKQAESIGIPLNLVRLPEQASNEDYEKIYGPVIEKYISQGVTHFVFGDIHLADVFDYRQEQLSPYGIQIVEPLWLKKTDQVIKEFLESGFKTCIICANGKYIDQSYIGKVLDKQMIVDFPAQMDICGENGEYHTFCFDGPIFKFPVDFTLGDTVSFSRDTIMKDGSVCQENYWTAEIKDSAACIGN